MALHLGDNHQFCLKESPPIRARVRADLEAIAEVLLEEVPQASIILSGSLVYGEGRIEPDGVLSRSDYDLYMVVPKLLQVRRLLGFRNRCVQRLSSLNLLTDLEVVVIWGPLAWRGLTHLPGIPLAGEPVMRQLAERPIFPPGDRNFCRAYACLLGALRGGANLGLLQRAVTRGFQSWLLGRVVEQRSFCLSDLFSFQGNLRYLNKHPGELAEPWREMVESVILEGLGKSSPRGTVDPKMVLAFLRWVRGMIQVSAFRWASLLYMVYQVRRHRSFVWPHRFLSSYLRLADSLAEVLSDSGTASIPGEIMRGIEGLVGAAYPSRSGTDQNDWVIREMVALANANPHKINIPRRQEVTTNLCSPR